MSSLKMIDVSCGESVTFLAPLCIRRTAFHCIGPILYSVHLATQCTTSQCDGTVNHAQ